MTNKTTTTTENKAPSTNKVNRYFEDLKKETSALKLFLPIFIGMLAVTEIEGPILLYLIKVFWKHQTFVFPNPLYGLIVSFILSVALALIISFNHRSEQK